MKMPSRSCGLEPDTDRMETKCLIDSVYLQSLNNFLIYFWQSHRLLITPQSISALGNSGNEALRKKTNRQLSPSLSTCPQSRTSLFKAWVTIHPAWSTQKAGARFVYRLFLSNTSTANSHLHAQLEFFRGIILPCHIPGVTLGSLYDPSFKPLTKH